MKSIPLYIHIPFCRIKCGYCTFYSTPIDTPDLERRFIEELIEQISHYMTITGSSDFDTIYLGGGTPSSLSIDSLALLFNALSKWISLRTREFTIECNPEDVNPIFLQYLNEGPVDRISLGVQSFSDVVLRESGRRTTTQEVEEAIGLIKQHWKGRFSIDLISGLPGQTSQGQLNDIEKAVKAGVDHISCYSLILEEKTPVSHHPLLPDSEEEDKQWKICRDYLIANGFSHYEVSNFALPGSESLHNMQYWQMNEYLGCGPGAVGMVRDGDIYRVTNPRNMEQWFEGKHMHWNCKKERISSADFLFENYMMGLRTEEGISRSRFKRRFNCYPDELISGTIMAMEEGTFNITEDNFTLSDEARLFMNPILIKISEELDDAPIDFEINWP